MAARTLVAPAGFGYDPGAWEGRVAMRITKGRLDSRASIRGAAVWLLLLLVAGWAGSVGGLRAQAGKTVWDAVYSEAQAERGKAAYEKDCAFCHLSDLAGQGFAPPLIDDTRSEERRVGKE